MTVLLNCGINSGNPSDDLPDGEDESLTFILQDAPVDSVESFFLRIKGVNFKNKKNELIHSHTYKEIKEINILDTVNSESLRTIETSIPENVTEAIVSFVLDPDNPSYVKTFTAETIPVAIPDLAGFPINNSAVEGYNAKNWELQLSEEFVEIVNIDKIVIDIDLSAMLFDKSSFEKLGGEDMRLYYTELINKKIISDFPDYMLLPIIYSQTAYAPREKLGLVIANEFEEDDIKVCFFSSGFRIDEPTEPCGNAQFFAPVRKKHLKTYLVEWQYDAIVVKRNNQYRVIGNILVEGGEEVDLLKDAKPLSKQEEGY